MAMELELHRIDLLQTSAASPGTLVVLPPGENKTQKVAVGDLSGVIQCFSVKKGEIVLAFKTLPSPQKVTSLVLGRAPRQRDKIFVAAGSSVRGLTKKGKEFFSFTSSLTEVISHLDVAETHIWASCQHILNHFVDGADKGLYMAPDRISASELLQLPGVPEWVPVIACKDCCIRIMSPQGTPLFEVATGAPPTALRYVAEAHGPSAAKLSNASELLYGCQDGRVVQLLVDAGAVRQGFTIQAPDAREARAAVTAIYCGADYSKTGCADIVIGREDGALEVWDVDGLGNPQLVVSTQLPESITAVSGGYLTSPASPDILVHTFTGKVIAFASHPGAMVLAAAAEQCAKGKSPPAAQQDLVAALNARIAKETADLADLRAQVAKEREKCAAPSGAAALVPQAVVDVRHRLTLQPQDGCFVLFVEAAVPLFALALQASVPLTLLDLPGNVAILSRSPPKADAGNPTLATYRCQESTNRLSIKFTAKEGAAGKISAYIIPAVPPKTCSVVQVVLHPLCLHQLVSNIGTGSVDGGRSSAAAAQGDLGEGAVGAALMERLRQSRPCNELVLKGSFSLQDIHTWLRSVLPDVPPHLGPGSTSAGHLFKHCQLGSLLGCQYSAESAEFICESISTMAILHDALLAAATAAQQRVDLMVKLHPSALQHNVSMLWPQVELQRGLARQQQLAAALQELQVQEGGLSCLSPEYRQMLSDQSQQQQSFGRKQSEHKQAQPGTAAARDAEGPSDEHGGLDDAVDAFKQLLKDYSRLSSGASGANKQFIIGMEKLLRHQAPLSQQDVFKHIANCV